MCSPRWGGGKILPNTPKPTRRRRNVLLFVSLAVLFLVGIHKLTNASLWFDETIEYWNSKIMVGTMPWRADTTSMYERIIATYQPPLYNIVMFFWLQISSTDWWFRFFGVLAGVIGGIGVFKAVEKMWNAYAAAISVLVLACTLRYIYYMQEAAEYTLLLAALGWFCYGWLCLLENPTWRAVLRYLLVCCVAAYSQYGAVLPILTFSLVAFVVFLFRKDKGALCRVSIGYVCAALFAALPLWYFFIRRQMAHQQEDVAHAFVLSRNLLVDLYAAFSSVMSFNLGYSGPLLTCLAAALVLFVLFFAKKSLSRVLIIANIFCFLLYYVLVKMSIYAVDWRKYGTFGIRYSLFFLPLWIPTIFCLLGDVCAALRAWHPAVKQFYRFEGLLLGAALFVCLTGWYRIKPNWQKEDIRGAVAAWYAVSGPDTDTLISLGGRSGFYYYTSISPRYDDNDYDNVVQISKPLEGASWIESNTYFDELYGDIWPQELYFVQSHMVGGEDTILELFQEKGYEQIEIFSGYDAQLVYLTKTWCGPLPQTSYE